jgi:predicted acetyltransferase
MAGAEAVSLDAATAADSTLLANLLELYIHDLSDVFDITLGADGRFGYPRLALYWSEPDRRFAFIIRCDGRVAGFALVVRGSPVVSDPDVLDVAEFFVVRRYRRSGVGRAAAFLLWNRIAGNWTIRVAEDNASAVSFWTCTAREYGGADKRETTALYKGRSWRVFQLRSKALEG